MLRFIFIALLVMFAFKAHAGPTSPLLGTWSEVNGTGLARIAGCPGGQSALCATGLRRNAAGRTVETGLVLSDVRPDGANRWRGTYHDGGRKLPATLEMIGKKQVRMKVCIMLFCQSATYARVK